jgi:hypothetical protein
MRIRTIKPEFWSSQDVADLPNDFDRLLFIGLWSFADDHGRGEAVTWKIAAALFPAQMAKDSTKVLMRINEGLMSLLRHRMITVYEVENRRYFAVVNWERHQKVPHPADSRFPAPDDCNSAVLEDTINPHEDDGKPHEDSCWEQGTGNREQGTGNEGTGNEGSPRATDFGMSELESYPTSFEQFWTVYPWQCDKPDAYREYRRATRKTSATIIIAAAGSYAAAQGKPGAPYTSKPATWLRNEGWLNKPQPHKMQAATRTQRAHDEWDEDRRIHDQLAAEERMAQHAVTN